MRIALIGSEPSGLALSAALVATGRHQVLYVTVPCKESTGLGEARHVADLEEVLADPAVDTILVASRLDLRAAHVRRALQSERLVLCLHPIDTRPEGAYEAGMLQQDTKQVLLPIMPDALHPAVLRLHEMLNRAHVTPSRSEPSIEFLARGRGDQHLTNEPMATGIALEKEAAIQVMAEHSRFPRQTSRKVEQSSLLGELNLLEIEHAATDEVLIGASGYGIRPCVPGWDIVRAIGGEIAEVSALSREEALKPGLPVLLSGCFAKQGLFQMALLPGRKQSSLRVRVIGSRASADLLFPAGLSGPAFLSWREENESSEQSWDAWNPWPRVIEVLEEAIASHGKKGGEGQPLLSWQDEIRCLELDDGVRRSVEKRRVSQMEYPEASEEVTFKGTMTLVGCALLWCIIFLAILSRWVPWIGWAAGPVLGVFLVLQLLRWIIPPREKSKEAKR